MHPDLDPDPAPRRPTTPRFRLRYAPIFGRLFVLALVLLEFVAWFHFVRPNVPFRPRLRRILVMIWLTFHPVHGLVPRAAVFAGVVTVLTDLFFRLALRPLMVRWYNPKPRDPSAFHGLPFQLAAGESIRMEVPARRIPGRGRSQPGTLIATDRRLCFYPLAWDADPWFLPLDQLQTVRPVSPRRRVLGWVEGYPDHLAVTDRAGAVVHFAVAEPAEVLAWFGGPKLEAVGGRR